MPLQPGEVSLLTLFADVHYYFSAPTASPSHHRFDKASYVYLYHDAINKRGRLEVANHAGTPEQDAFAGFLDASEIEYSHKHPVLVTITVDAREQTNGMALPQQDTSHWHLPAHDMRNEKKYMYKLHTIDLYFWTTDDATMFIDSMKRCVQPQQLHILGAALAGSSSTLAEHRDSMSPVVQRLEKVAITNPQLQVQRNSVLSTAQSSAGAPMTAHTPVNPMNPTPAPAPASAGAEVPGNYAPMAYNPAAPAAPEPIAHREKTPPPADAAGGTGLSHAAVYEHGSQGYPPQPVPLQHQGSFGMTHQSQVYIPGPPTQQAAIPPPPQTQLQRASTHASFSSPPPQPQSLYQGFAGSPSPQPGSQYVQSFAGPPQQQHQDANAHLYGQQQLHAGLQGQSTLPQLYNQQYMPQQAPQSPPPLQQSFSPQPPTPYANYAPSQTPSYQQAPSSVGYRPQQQPQTPGYGQQSSTPGFGSQPTTPVYVPPPHLLQQPQQPIGGYSNYNYSQQQAPQTPQQAYEIHQQAYRPTEQEAQNSHGKYQAGQPAQAGPGVPGPGKTEQRIAKVEKGVGRFLKRLDKKF